ncbi:MAG: hypothetical protein WCC60_14470 [Ilumatobacteraceae bacterium]
MWWLRHAPELRAGSLALVALAVVWPRSTVARVVVAGVGGIMLTASAWHVSFAGRSNSWAVVLSVLAAVLLWWAAPRLHAALAPPGGAWLVLLGSVAAVYACVPETDQLREVGVVVVAGGLAELLLRRRLPSGALVGAVVLVQWSALFGATGQARALASGLFALSPLVAVAVVTSVAASRAEGRATTVRLAWVVAALWVLAAIVVARTGGIASSLQPAAVAVTAAAAVSTVVSAVLVRRARR